MSNLDRIVDVVITRQTAGLATKDFSTGMILSQDAIARSKSYNSASEVLADYSSTAPEYYSSLVYFNQPQRPKNLIIGWHNSGSETITEALTAVNEDNQNWYGFSTLDITPADVVLASAWAISNKKFLFTASANSLIVTGTKASDTTSIAYLLNQATANKTTLFYNSKVRSVVVGEELLGYADVAFMSYVSAQTVGSYTTVYKTLANCTIDNLTSSQVNNAFDKNTNVYIEIAGTNCTDGGRVTDGNANGEWTDTEIGLDWLQARIQEEVFTIFKNNKKIPYTNTGATSVEQGVETVLKRGVSQDFIAEYTTTRGAVEEQSVADRTARIYNGINFDARLAGAIHTTTINGTVRY